jgi:hypothetical protein
LKVRKLIAGYGSFTRNAAAWRSALDAFLRRSGF